MRLTVLGSGTSHGVPMIGCECAVCQSPDPKNRRYRPSLLITADTGENVIVDTPPELRLALIERQVRRLDAILYTHSHADHIYGLDDIRTFNYRTQNAMPIYAESSVLDDLQRAYQYIFTPTQEGGGKPQVRLNKLTPAGDEFSPFTLFGLSIRPLRVWHGALPILAFLFDSRFAYVTDVSLIPPETWPYLENLDLLMLDAVRRKPHETHFHLAESLRVIERLAPKRALLTHLSHDYDHESTNAELPARVELAYDGQVVSLS